MDRILRGRNSSELCWRAGYRLKGVDTTTSRFSVSATREQWKCRPLLASDGDTNSSVEGYVMCTG